MSKTCKEEGCERVVKARGLCHTHYEKLRRNKGLPTFSKITLNYKDPNSSDVNMKKAPPEKQIVVNLAGLSKSGRAAMECLVVLAKLTSEEQDYTIDIIWNMIKGGGVEEGEN